MYFTELLWVSIKLIKLNNTDHEVSIPVCLNIKSIVWPSSKFYYLRWDLCPGS